MPLIVNSRQTPCLTEDAAVHRAGEHRLQLLFFTDPATGRGNLLYPRYDGNLGLIAPFQRV
ncbi:putative ribosome-associated protein Y [Mycobacterium kansasii]|uniref:Putative ribosome-associated protein Y n=1 Tax=Mycobacterium kansasii TaxID=1768 RepID=A0A1V3XPL4_MYCKA|nr:putative ribosome-associated protein Y [Mycobacterium kansasii]